MCLADNLEVLSIGRNQIKKLEGLDDVAGTLRELWISYNLIDKLNGLEKVPVANFLLLYNSQSCYHDAQPSPNSIYFTLLLVSCTNVLYMIPI